MVYMVKWQNDSSLILLIAWLISNSNFTLKHAGEGGGGGMSGSKEKMEQ